MSAYYDPAAAPQGVLTVAQLTDVVKELLEAAIPSVWVSGEISNFSRPQSGHCYLTLKDDAAQIKAVIWRNTALRVRSELHDGLEVICHGHLDVYAPRGTYQLVIEEIQPRGLGALELALRKLRDKLAAEGLFNVERKRPLPILPRRIAVVTSPTGAAIRDFLQILERRYSGVHVLIVPVRVQGIGSADEIAAGIALANALVDPPDVIVVTRGGGSLEDLWSFNEEVVIRAIYGSRIPVVSAIGHEIDVTLADLVADVRALTPSEAAERIVPAAEAVRAAVIDLEQRLRGSLARLQREARSRLEALAARAPLRRPFDRVHDASRELDRLGRQASLAIERCCAQSQQSIESLAARLESLSPLAVLGRGYAAVWKLGSEQLITASGQLSPGDRIALQFAAGRAVARVEEISPDTVDRNRAR